MTNRSLEGASVVVTGGGTGIGAACARKVPPPRVPKSQFVAEPRAVSMPQRTISAQPVGTSRPLLPT